jgi:hypothetical protein
MASELVRIPLLLNEDRRDSELWAVADLATPMAVRVVATLRIADHIARGLRSELAKASNAKASVGVVFTRNRGTPREA